MASIQMANQTAITAMIFLNIHKFKTFKIPTRLTCEFENLTPLLCWFKQKLEKSCQKSCQNVIKFYKMTTVPHEKNHTMRNTEKSYSPNNTY